VTSRADVCQEVPENSVSQKLISPDDFVGADQCDEVEETTIDNLRFSSSDSSRKIRADQPSAVDSPNSAVATASADKLNSATPSPGPKAETQDVANPSESQTKEEATEEPESPPDSDQDGQQPVEVNQAASDKPYVVVAASIKQSLSDGRERAEKKAAHLREAGFDSASVVDGRVYPNFSCCFWVVVADSFEKSEDAEALKSEVVNAGFEAYVKNAFKK